MAKSKKVTPTPEPVSEFRPLEKEYSQYGYKFRQLKREGLVAMYEQLAINDDTGEESLVCYEVFEINQMPAGFAGPKKYPQPAREVSPSKEQWGLKGFSPTTLERAEMRFKELQARIALRGAQSAPIEEKVVTSKSNVKTKRTKGI